MKKFVKGNLTTIVEDNDRRIPEYLANGWEQKQLTPKAKDITDEIMESAIADANANENNDKKNHATDKKVNDAIEANITATAESEAVDDGLIKPTSGGNSND